LRSVDMTDEETNQTKYQYQQSELSAHLSLQLLVPPDLIVRPAVHE
jgi:hypothetical protein